MGNALSLDLRKRVVEAYHADDKAGYVTIGKRFGVAKETVRSWVKLLEETGSLEPLPDSGGSPTQKIFAEHEEAVKAWLEETPDMFQYEIAEKLAQEFGIEVQQPAISKLLDRLGLTRKKKL